MSLRHRLFGFYVGFISICTLGAIVYAPQGARGQPPKFPDGTIHIMIPQFVAEAVSFKAIDESGYDWAGSDEVYAVFSDLNPNLSDLVTSTYGDVDTGETRNFGTDDRCIAPQSKCDHGVSEILRFEVAFWEEDKPLWGGSDSIPPFPASFCHGDAPGLHQILSHGKCGLDDLIGRGEILMSREQLLAALPRVGDSVEYKLTLGGPCGYQPDQPLCTTGWGAPSGPEYELTYRITRLPDVERPIVIAPPR